VVVRGAGWYFEDNLPFAEGFLVLLQERLRFVDYQTSLRTSLNASAFDNPQAMPLY